MEFNSQVFIEYPSTDKYIFFKDEWTTFLITRAVRMSIKELDFSLF